MTKGAEHLFAVVRVDRPHDGSLDQFLGNPTNYVTVKEVLPTLEEAEREVARLTALNAEKGCVYFAQTTRFFAGGRDARS